MIGSTEILIIVGVIFVLFGAKKIPDFARSLGKAKKEFKLGLEDEDKEKSNKEETVS